MTLLKVTAFARTKFPEVDLRMINPTKGNLRSRYAIFQDGKPATSFRDLRAVQAYFENITFKVGVKTAGDVDWVCNSQRFATREEAHAYGVDLYHRWMLVRQWTVLPSPDPANYTFKDGRSVSLNPVAA